MKNLRTKSWLVGLDLLAAFWPQASRAELGAIRAIPPSQIVIAKMTCFKSKA